MKSFSNRPKQQTIFFCLTKGAVLFPLIPSKTNIQLRHFNCWLKSTLSTRLDKGLYNSVTWEHDKSIEIICIFINQSKTSGTCSFVDFTQRFHSDESLSFLVHAYQLNRFYYLVCAENMKMMDHASFFSTPLIFFLKLCVIQSKGHQHSINRH